MSAEARVFALQDIILLLAMTLHFMKAVKMSVFGFITAPKLLKACKSVVK